MLIVNISNVITYFLLQIAEVSRDVIIRDDCQYWQYDFRLSLNISIFSIYTEAHCVVCVNINTHKAL